MSMIKQSGLKGELQQSGMGKLESQYEAARIPDMGKGSLSASSHEKETQVGCGAKEYW